MVSSSCESGEEPECTVVWSHNTMTLLTGGDVHQVYIINPHACAGGLL